MSYMDPTYWQEKQKPEGFRAWEKRHVNCLQTRDGKLYYDWTAAKRVGKRNGQVPPGMANGIIGRGLPPLAECPEWERQLYANAPDMHAIAWREHCLRVPADKRHTYDDWHGLWHLFLEPGEAKYVKGKCHCRLCKAVRRHEDSLTKEYGWGRRVLLALRRKYPSPPTRISTPKPEPDLTPKYAEYVALVSAAGLTPRSYEAWVANLKT